MNYKNARIFFLIIILFSAYNTAVAQLNTLNVSKNIPSLDEMSGIWLKADTIAMEPSIRNFRGAALTNRDATSISWLASAPYSAGYHTGVMRINGEIPMVEKFRWQPYQALRKCKVNNLDIVSSTRMLPDENAVLWKIEIKNNTKGIKDLNIEQDLIAFMGKFEKRTWQWWFPYPTLDSLDTKRDGELDNVRKHIGLKQAGDKGVTSEIINGIQTGKMIPVNNWPTDNEILNSNKYSSKIINDNLFIFDSRTNVVSVFCLATKPDNIIVKNSGGTARWKSRLKPGETKVIKFLMAFGDNQQTLSTKIKEWGNNFDSTFAKIENVWQDKWQKIFTPKNALISGCFPVLETKDALAKRVYYMGPLTMLYLLNTHLPAHKREILTGGPIWGASITFYWDITVWSKLWSMTDPEMVKDHIKTWLQIDPDKYYGQDNLSGNGVGNAYRANYWALFQIIHSYITVTGDRNFLNEKVNGQTILENMERLSMNWKKLSRFGEPGYEDDIYKLADFGDNIWNLLECVPTYRYVVPSFNVGYIWMMRETAKVYLTLGNQKKADELNQNANEMLGRVMKLYNGDGTWNTLYPNNKRMEVRHSLDFMYVSKYLANDIPDSMKTAMIDFVEKELMTNHWMRAQSLKDPVAAESDRPDHGPMGSYDGWPPEIMEGLSQLGQTQKALNFYHAIEPATLEGSWTQSHELWGENSKNKNARVRIAERGGHDREASAGITNSQVMIKSFFGFDPGFSDNPLQKISNINFQGTLHHVFYHGEYYSIVLKNNIRSMKKENIR